MIEDDDIVAFVQRHSAADRLAWIALVDGACATAERRRRTLQRKARDRAQAVLVFIEQANAVLFWLRTADRPQTGHDCVAPAIAHITRSLGPRP